MLFHKNMEVNKVVLLPLSRISRNPHQPRKVFMREDIEELAASIRDNGLIQPITVRRVGEEYELVAGERRTMAFRELGETSIPAIVEDFSDQQSAVLALIENLQRKDLNCFEEAYGISRLLDESGISQQEIARRLGKAQSTIANKLRLLKFPAAVQKRLMNASLTERHARALLKLEDEKQLQDCIDYILKKDLNVQQTEEYIESLLKEEPPPRTKRFIIKDMRLFTNTIKKAVDMMNLAGIPAKSEKRDTGDYLEYTITVPKEAVYKTKAVEKTEMFT
jgi:ParB family chromosome partitioning protein